MSIAILVNSDGTIIKTDSTVQVLAKFATDNWKIIDQEYEEDKITLEECLVKQFSLNIWFVLIYQKIY